MPAVSVEFTLDLPLFASATLLLFHTINNPMTVLISIVFFHITPVFLVTFPGIFSFTLLAPNPQPVLVGETFTKLTFFFPIFAFTASLHFFPAVLRLYMTGLADMSKFGLPQKATYYQINTEKENIGSEFFFTLSTKVQ